MSTAITPRPARFRRPGDFLRPSSAPLSNRQLLAPTVADLVGELVALADDVAARSLTENTAVRAAFGRAIDEVFGLGRTPRHRAGPPPGWVLVERAMVRSTEIAAGEAGAETAPGSLRGAVADVRATVAVAEASAPTPRALVVLASYADEALISGAAAALGARHVSSATVVAATEPIHDKGHLLDAEVHADHHSDQSWFVSDRRARDAAAFLQARGVDADTSVVPARLLAGAVEDQIDAGGVTAIVTVGSKGRLPFTAVRRVARLARRAGVEHVAA